jgi:hypothetical protein
MPVKISGFVINDSKTNILNQRNVLQNLSSDSGGKIIAKPNYFVSWFWDILPSGSQNQVELS